MLDKNFFWSRIQGWGWISERGGNDNLSESYGERTLTYDKPGTDVDEEGEGIAVAYTMGSI